MNIEVHFGLVWPRRVSLAFLAVTHELNVTEIQTAMRDQAFTSAYNQIHLTGRQIAETICYII